MCGRGRGSGSGGHVYEQIAFRRKQFVELNKIMGN